MRVAILMTTAGARLYAELCRVGHITVPGKTGFIIAERDDQRRSLYLVERNTSPPKGFEIFAANGRLVVDCCFSQEAMTALELLHVKVTSESFRQVTFAHEIMGVVHSIIQGVVAA